MECHRASGYEQEGQAQRGGIALFDHNLLGHWRLMLRNVAKTGI